MYTYRVQLEKEMSSLTWRLTYYKSTGFKNSMNESKDVPSWYTRLEKYMKYLSAKITCNQYHVQPYKLCINFFFLDMQIWHFVLVFNLYETLDYKEIVFDTDMSTCTCSIIIETWKQPYIMENLNGKWMFIEHLENHILWYWNGTEMCKLNTMLNNHAPTKNWK